MTIPPPRIPVFLIIPPPAFLSFFLEASLNLFLNIAAVSPLASLASLTDPAFTGCPEVSPDLGPLVTLPALTG